MNLTKIQLSIARHRFSACEYNNSDASNLFAKLSGIAANRSLAEAVQHPEVHRSGRERMQGCPAGAQQTVAPNCVVH